MPKRCPSQVSISGMPKKLSADRRRAAISRSMPTKSPGFPRKTAKIVGGNWIMWP
jgi:hypothetical protein